LKVCFRATYIFFPIAFATVRAALGLGNADWVARTGSTLESTKKNLCLELASLITVQAIISFCSLLQSKQRNWSPFAGWYSVAKNQPQGCMQRVSNFLQLFNHRQGQTFMVIGAAGELPKPPEKPIVFLEGISHLCYNAKFFLRVDQIWMTRSSQRL
jgi:hypothetical protein